MIGCELAHFWIGNPLPPGDGRWPADVGLGFPVEARCDVGVEERVGIALDLDVDPTVGGIAPPHHLFDGAGEECCVGEEQFLTLAREVRQR